jgi:putative Holliday junction resolvase
MTETEDKTIIGIDYGSRRIGLAKSDPTGLIASALTTLEVSSRNEAVAKIAEVIEKYRPAAIVVGYPLSMSGEQGTKCREVDEFIELLRGVYKGPIHKVDERLSSAEAAQVIHAHGRKTGQDKKRLDRLAAVIILQRFLDQQQ